MRKVLLVLRHEVITTITSRSFLFAAFGVPLISALVIFGASLLNRSAPSAISEIFGAGGQISGQEKHEGYVDYSGLIRVIPDSLPAGALQAFADEKAASQAVEAGKISAYYIIPADYLQTGQVIYVRPDFNPLSAFDQTGVIQQVLQVNLLGGNLKLANQIENPLNLQIKVLEPSQQRDQNNPLTFFLPYAVTMIYYVVIIMSSSLLLNSVTKEKENRVVEILMSAVTPRQLLSGKIAGLGLVGLLQTILWVGTGLLLLRLSGRAFSIPAVFQLPASFLIWGILFFLLGYAVYASLMAAVGALVPNLREASQATFLVIFPLLIPLFAISILIDQPDGPLAVILSLFPLTAPVTMMTRLAATSVPLWQTLLSAVVLGLTGVIIVRAVAGMFRAQTLLSGQSFSLKNLFNALAGRA
jgi:ABC-2 type transport system permease protein